jgi:predicted lysophospholipase L1 biosynthesis ABC-type transport system permease subunit
MRISFPVLVCLVGAVGDFWLWLWLRKFRVRERPPASRIGLSVEERQRKVTIGSRIAFASGWFFLAGAVFLAWLQSRSEHIVR